MLDWIRTRSKRDLVLALAVAGGFVFLVGTFLVARVTPESGHDVAVFEGAHAGGIAFDQAFAAERGGELEIRLGDADVSVGATSGSEARVILHVEDAEISAADLMAEMGFEVRASGRSLTIRTEDRNRGWDHHDADLRLEVTVPREFDITVGTGDGDVAIESFQGDIDIHTGDGDVAVGAVAGPALRVRTGDGDVSVAGAASRAIMISTGDGNVSAQSLEGEDIQIRTGDGDIMLADMSGRFRASTGDGDVQVHLVRFEGLEIRTGDGDVTIYAPAGLRADVDFTGSEFVIGDAFALPATFDRRSLEGVLNGGGDRLSVRVGDGRVSLIER